MTEFLQLIDKQIVEKIIVIFTVTMPKMADYYYCDGF